jgi:hypothetical protein
VFRNVEVGPGVSLEPVDLHILKHDVREAASALVDTSCRVLRGQLGCAGAIHSATYTMWIVPENTVDKLGPGVMARAVAGGLASAQTAAMQ